jgi:hypothetical protein
MSRNDAGQHADRSAVATEEPDKDAINGEQMGRGPRSIGPEPYPHLSSPVDWYQAD